MINKKIRNLLILCFLTQNTHGFQAEQDLSNIETMDELQSKVEQYFEKNIQLQKALWLEIQASYDTLKKLNLSGLEKIKMNMHLNKMKELILEIPIARSEGEFLTENLSENFIKNLVDNRIEDFYKNEEILNEDLEKQKNNIQKRIAERIKKRISPSTQNIDSESLMPLSSESSMSLMPLPLEYGSESDISGEDVSTEASSQKEEYPFEGPLEEKSLDLSNKSFENEETVLQKDNKDLEDINNISLEKKETVSKETQTDIPQTFDQEAQVNFSSPFSEKKSTDKKTFDLKSRKPGYWDSSTRAYSPILSTDFPKKKTID